MVLWQFRSDCLIRRRPAVVISYSVAALAALISALSYTEFVVDLPTAGGAYNYISLVFGEFTAW